MERYDNTELSDWRRCPLLGYYRYVLRRRLKARNSMSLLYGEAVHYAIELAATGVPYEDAIQKAAGQFEPFDHGQDSKRNSVSLRNLLSAYFEYYERDPFESREVERFFSLPLGDFEYCGRLDRYGKYPRLGRMMTVDTKTTSSLTKLNVDPNNQFTGYCWAGPQLYEEFDGMLIDYLGVYKDKPRKGKSGDWLKDAAPWDVFIRVSVNPSADRIAEWKRNVIEEVSIIRGYKDRGIYPMHDEQCFAFGVECEYKMVCQMDPGAREYMLNSDMYEEYIWNPMKN